MGMLRLGAHLLLLAAATCAAAGVTSEYRRKLEATVDMPLDADVFRVPPGYNAPQQVQFPKLSSRRRRYHHLSSLGNDESGSHHSGGPDGDGDDGVVGDGERAGEQHGEVRELAGEAGARGGGEPHALRLLQLHVRVHPPLHPRRPQARRQVLLRHGLRPHRPYLLLHHAAQARSRRPLQVRPHRRPRADVRLQQHAGALRGQRRRRHPLRRRPLLRRQPLSPRQQPLGHVGALRGAQRRLPAVDLDRRQPRAGLRAGAGGDGALQAIHPPLPDAVPRRRQHGALLVLRQGGLRARHRAGLLLRLRQVHAAVDMAAGRARHPRRPRGHPLAHRAHALALVQQQQLPLHGGGDDAGPVRAVARRRQGGPGARRTRPLVRAQPQVLQHRLRHRQRQGHAGSERGRAGVHHHRRRRQHRGHRRQLLGAAAEVLGVPGGQLRARHAGDQEPDARALRVAPQPRRRQGRRRRRLAHQSLLDAHQRRRMIFFSSSINNGVQASTPSQTLYQCYCHFSSLALDNTPTMQ